MNIFQKVYYRSFQAVICRIEKMNRNTEIPARLSGVIKKEDLDGLAEHAYKEAHPLYPTPVPWDKERLQAVYREIGGEE